MKHLICLCVILFSALSTQVFADNDALKVADVFSSHMVLQQNEPIKVWGEATAGTAVTIELGEITHKVLTDASGQWSTVFDPLKASKEALQLKVNQLLFEDILIGEVWLCSGQSNMNYKLKGTANVKELLANADLPQLRIFHKEGLRLVAKKGFSQEELERCNTEDFFQAKWEVSSPATAKTTSAVAWLFGHGLLNNLDVPIGIIQVSVGGSALNNWIPEQALKSYEGTSSWFQKDWLSNEDISEGHRKRARDAFQSVMSKEQVYIPGEFPYRWMCEPGFLFDAGIAALKGLSFRGVLWYQGEADAEILSQINRAADLFPLLVNQWREHFDQKDLPFIYVQLPGFKREYWPVFREMQRQSLSQIDNASMVVTIDLGLENNIHPNDKVPVGERAVQLALKDVYGLKKHLGFPEIKKSKLKGHTVVLTFDECGDGFLPVEGDVNGFEIADADGVFHKADATIVNGNKIKVTSAVLSPIELRYLWIPYPKTAVQLYNSEVLPLGPFVLKF